MTTDKETTHIATAEMIGDIFPRRGRRPYYIYAPPYVRTSAGVKVLHLLCHALNKVGELAFVTTDKINPELLTPILTSEIVSYHFQKQLTPIIIYPEVVFGNPLNAPVVVRYLLNFPGVISGPDAYPEGDLLVGYSAELVETQAKEFQASILFLPACDTSIFNLNDLPLKREGTCFYAGKYRDVHGGDLFETTANSIEIYGPWNPEHTPQSAEEVAAIFKRSTVFYCYENTALTMEAALCGCPTVVLPNRFLTKKIGGAIVGDDGIAWGDSPKEVARAKATVSKFHGNYQNIVENFWNQLQPFIDKTQREALKKSYESPVTFAGIHDDLGKPPQSWLGKALALLFTIYRVVKVDGCWKVIRQMAKHFGDARIKGVKNYIKASYADHREWVRRQID